MEGLWTLLVLSDRKALSCSLCVSYRGLQPLRDNHSASILMEWQLSQLLCPRSGWNQRKCITRGSLGDETDRASFSEEIPQYHAEIPCFRPVWIARCACSVCLYHAERLSSKLWSGGRILRPQSPLGIYKYLQAPIQLSGHRFLHWLQTAHLWKLHFSFHFHLLQWLLDLVCNKKWHLPFVYR